MLTPAYDMVATALVNPADTEDLALTLNGKKKKIKKEDFLAAFATLKLPPATQRSLLFAFSRHLSSWLDFIDTSFLSQEMKETYRQLVQKKVKQLDLI